MIALIDCNNFYASCEKVFDPFLKDKPVIILSNNDGCAIARSQEAKALGVEMAQPVFMIEKLVADHDIRVYSSNYTLYGDMSSRVMQVIRELVPRTEIYSIDEIFADLSGMKYISLPQLARDIKEAVERCTGIHVSVGIAATKTLAKMANRFAKKTKNNEGVYVANDEASLATMMSVMEVGDIWGIGKQYADFLRANGFIAAKDLLHAPEEWIRKNMSVTGQRLLKELKGISCIRWEDLAPPRKNICTSRSFGQLVKDKKVISQAVAQFTASCAAKMRKEKICARKIQVFVQTNPHRPQDEQYFQSVTMELQVPSNLSTELVKYAMKGLEMIFRPGFNYQKAGVVVQDLIPANEIQLGLFDQVERPKHERLMKSLDQVNQAFGKDMVRFGVHDYGKDWKLKRASLSPAYTTRLDQVPVVGENVKFKM